MADRVAGLLIRRGFTSPLIDAGEMRLPGPERHPIDLPEAGMRLHLAGAAVATSAPGALFFDTAGKRHHLFDPHSGDNPGWWRRVTVIAPTAEAAPGGYDWAVLVSGAHGLLAFALFTAVFWPILTRPRQNATA